MSGKVPDHDGRAAPVPGGVDVDATEVLDLDTRFGLSAFGPEGPDERAGTSPLPEPAGPFPTSAGDFSPQRIAPWGSPIGEPDAATREALGPGLAPAVGEALRTGASVPAWPLAPVLAPRSSASLRRWIGPSLAVGLLLLLLAIVGASLWLRRPVAPPAGTTGELTVDSTPGGARVIIEGKDRGRTPLSLTLAPGTYGLELRAGGERHTLTVRVKQGATTAQHVFLRKTRSPGTLRITSEPPAAAVAVDGRRRGTTPVLITDLAAGAHDVVVTGTSGSVRQRVQIDPDATTTVMVPLPRSAAPQSAGGWLSITTPTELQIFEGTRLLGTTRVNPLMLPTGSHTLRLSNEAAGIDLTREVTIERGQTARLPITLAPGTMSINAMPWATVSIDGREVGETPLGGVEVSPGTHEVVFTHPELGERRQRVTVRAGGTARVAVDFRR